jgi:hypothetical protein
MAKFVKYQRQDKPNYFNFGIELENGWIVGIKPIDYHRDYYQLVRIAEEVTLKKYKKKGS